MLKTALLLAATVALVPSSGSAVSVAYAGSLVRVMEGPVAAALARDTGLQFSGEAKGSKALAHLIAAGLRAPDVFVSADPALMKGLAPCSVFGSAKMVVAFSNRSRSRGLLESAAAGKRSILDVLAQPGVTVASTDPAVDPKGERTLSVLALLGKHYRNSSLARLVRGKLQLFPEEDLAVRVESGEADAGFFYSTEVPGRDLRAIDLPRDVRLSSQIVYAVAQMPHAPHPAAAAAFVDFILHGPGRRILEASGVQFFAQVRRISM